MSWENPPYHNEEAYEKLCENSKPSDFYFHAQNDVNEVSFGATWIAIVPKEYWNTHKYMWDQSMFLDHILPEDFGESMESIWDSERPVEEVRKDLLARGFEENEEFTNSVKKDFDSDE